jgi:hypothetical protein
MPIMVAPSGTRHHRIGANTGFGTHGDRAQHLRAGADDGAIQDSGMALAARAASRIGAAQRHALIDGHLVTDLGGLADHHEAVIDEEIAADTGTGVDVDGGEEAAEMIDQSRGEEKVPAEQQMGDAVQPKRPDAGIGKDFPARTRRRIALFHRVEIGDQTHGGSPAGQKAATDLSVT